MTKTLFDAFLVLGSDWVLWLLLGLSVLSLSVIFSRFVALKKQEDTGDKLWKEHIQPWMNKTKSPTWRSEAAALAKKYPCVESRILEVLSQSAANEKAEMVAGSVAMQERVGLEKHLGILGTLGNNAPFIGLFGTVLGIIRAFHDLGGNMESAGAQSVSAGLAEALVATAVGLFVAIPSVMFFNYFNRKIKTIMTRAESLSSYLIGSGT